MTQSLTERLMAERRLIDGPEARAQIAEQAAAGTGKSAQKKMAALALKHALLTESARAAWQEVLDA